MRVEGCDRLRIEEQTKEVEGGVRQGEEGAEGESRKGEGLKVETREYFKPSKVDNKDDN